MPSVTLILIIFVLIYDFYYPNVDIPEKVKEEEFWNDIFTILQPEVEYDNYLA